MKKKSRGSGKVGKKIRVGKHKVLTAARKAEIERQAVFDTANIGGMPVVAFGHEALREAFRVWWKPWRGMGPDFEALCGSAVYKPFSRGKTHGFKLTQAATVVSGSVLMLHKLDPYHVRMGRRTRSAKPSKKKHPVKVRLTITYPVAENQTKIVTLDRRYPGEIFAMLHDFYREIYAEDERRGGKAGPMNKHCLNRASGPIVWGHDIGDLVIETVHYKALTKKEKNGDGAEGAFQFGIGS